MLESSRASRHQAHAVEIEGLGPRSLEAVLALQAAIHAECGSARYVPLEPEYVTLAIARGQAVGAIHRGELVGACLGFGDAEEVEAFSGKINSGPHLVDGEFVCFTYFVDAKARGDGIAKSMLALSVANSAGQGLKHAIATVAPDNGPSLKTLLDSGFRIGYVGPVYGKEVRFVTWRDTAPPQPLLTASFSDRVSGDDGISSHDERWVISTDVPRQRLLLESGYAGTAVKRSGQDTLVLFTRD